MVTLNTRTNPDLISKSLSDSILLICTGCLTFYLSCRPETNNRCCTYSPDGKYFAWACNEEYALVLTGIVLALLSLTIADTLLFSVKIANPNTGELVTTLPAQNVHEIGFSPRGSYIITWERPSMFNPFKYQGLELTHFQPSRRTAVLRRI